MDGMGVKSQWEKRLVLQKQHKTVPGVIAELKDLLVMPKSAAGATAYKDVKDRILEAFGSRPEDAFRRARMTGKPSQFANKLINILCRDNPKLEKCTTCAGVISSLWRDQLPPTVRAAVADLPLTGSKLKSTLSTADSVYAAMSTKTANAAQIAAAVPDTPTDQD